MLHSLPRHAKGLYFLGWGTLPGGSLVMRVVSQRPGPNAAGPQSGLAGAPCAAWRQGLAAAAARGDTPATRGEGPQGTRVLTTCARRAPYLVRDFPGASAGGSAAAGGPREMEE